VHYIPYATSIQGWDRQPSLTEFENLLSSGESLAYQMARSSISGREGYALFSDKKKVFDKGKEKKYESKGEGASSKSDGNRKGTRCFHCNKIGNIKKNCRVKLKSSDVAMNEGGCKDEDWRKCFMTETTNVNAMTSISFEADWIVDSGFGHHLTRDAS